MTEQAADLKAKKTVPAKKAAPAKKVPAKKAAAPKAAAPKAEKPAKAPKAEKAPKAPKAPKAEKAPVDRSAAVSATWSDPEVKAARNLKSRVKVGDVEYRSTLAAFIALQLPVNKHIGFRSELKANGKATFKTEDGTKHNFKIIQPVAA